MNNINKLYQAIADILNVDLDTLNEDSSSDNIPNWDSQAIISLVCELEQIFDVEFDILEIADIRDIKVIINLLGNKGIVF